MSRNHTRISQRRTHRKKVRKQNRSLFITLLIFTFLFSAFISTGATASKVADTETIRIAAGDTLWNIASECNTEGDDVRDIMDDIMKLNNLKSAELHVGDVITIPVY